MKLETGVPFLEVKEVRGVNEVRDKCSFFRNLRSRESK